MGPSLPPPAGGPGGPAGPGGLGGPPAGPSGPPTPGAQLLEQTLKSILSAGGSESTAVAQLQQTADTILAEGQDVTTAQLTQLEQVATQAIGDPTLSPPDQIKVKLCLAQLLKTQIQMGFSGPTGGVIPTAGGNKFLDEAAIVELFKVLSNIAQEETKIKFEESQLKISLAKFTIQTAEQISELIVEMGDIAAQECIAQASEYMTDGASAVADAINIGASLAMSEIAEGKVEDNYEKEAMGKEYADYEKDPTTYTQNNPQKAKEFRAWDNYKDAKAETTAAGTKDVATQPEQGDRTTPPQGEFFKKFKDGYAPDPKTKAILQEKVATKMKQWSELVSKTISGASAFAKATIEYQKAGLKRESSAMDAAKNLLQTLKEMLDKTGDMLGKDVDSLESSIQKVLQMFEDAARTYAQMGRTQG